MLSTTQPPHQNFLIRPNRVTRWNPKLAHGLVPGQSRNFLLAILLVSGRNCPREIPPCTGWGRPATVSMHEVKQPSSRTVPVHRIKRRRQAVDSRRSNQLRAIAGLFLALCCVALGGCQFLHRTVANHKSTGPVANTKPTAKVSVGPGATTAASSRTAPTAPASSIPAATREVRVGEIRVIGAGRRFVLVEVTQRPDLPFLSPGLELRSRSPASAAIGGEQTGDLRVSPERRQPFIVADVIAGEPHVGDPVFYSSENQLHLVPASILSPALAPSSSATPDFDSTASHP